MTIDTAMVLAAGLGTRMRGTIDHPKCMITLAGKTLIEHILNMLYEDGIKRVVINTHFQAEKLEQHILGLPISSKIEVIFSREQECLETAGGIINALNLINREEFLIVNTDVFWVTKTKSAVRTLIDSWNPSIMDKLFLILPTIDNYGYRDNGDFNLANNMQLAKNSDKKDYVYIGLSIVKASFFANYELKKMSLVKIWQDRENSDHLLRGMYGTVFDGKWLHIGDPESKNGAEEYLIKTKNSIEEETNNI